MREHYSGLPAAANVEESIIKAQLQIMRNLQEARRAGLVCTVVTGPAEEIEFTPSWNPEEAGWRPEEE
jgi:hypothetical protein